MNKTTQKICTAFQKGEVKREGNTFTDGKCIYLFDNAIAEHREDGLYVTNAGWFTRTTKERLNGIQGVNVSQSKGIWYLNGEEWGGEWIRVNNDKPPVVDMKSQGNAWNYSKKYVSTDAWRGYEEPMYAVCGANDTGMWSDSPCKSDIAKSELDAAKLELQKLRIQTKLITCETSNLFCVHHYLIVRPKDKVKADEILSEYYKKADTSLLYTCN